MYVKLIIAHVGKLDCFRFRAFLVRSLCSVIVTLDVSRRISSMHRCFISADNLGR